MENRRQLDGVAVGLLLVLCLSWGLQQVAIKAIVTEVSPVLQAAIRSIGATLLVSLWMIARKRPLFPRDGTLWWGVAAGLLFAFEFMLIYWGLDYTLASRAAIFLYTSPFVVALGSWLFIPSEKLRLDQVMGLACAFLGVVVIFGQSFDALSGATLIGDAMLIGAAILWGATTVLIKASPLRGIDPGRVLLYQLAVSALVLPLGSLALDEPGVTALTPFGIVSLLYQTVWIAAITYLVWFWLIRHYPAPRVASFSFLTPVFGVAAGALLLGDQVSVKLLLALGLVASGIYLVNRPAARKPVG
ncbi:MAG: DMT family transporter [Magnetospiraceae bacterium]